MEEEPRAITRMGKVKAAPGWELEIHFRPRITVECALYDPKNKGGLWHPEGCMDRGESKQGGPWHPQGCMDRGESKLNPLDCFDAEKGCLTAFRDATRYLHDRTFIGEKVPEIRKWASERDRLWRALMRYQLTSKEERERMLDEFLRSGE